MDNVESAEAGGDAFPTTRVLTADGIVSLIGCLLGNPFINAVYIGHPGWKAIGGRIGYSAGARLMGLGLAWLGVLPLLVAGVLGGDRADGPGAVVVRRPRALDGGDPGRRDLADPALHRHADRRAGVPGDAE